MKQAGHTKPSIFRGLVDGRDRARRRRSARRGQVLVGGALREGAQLVTLGARRLEALPQVFSFHFLALEVLCYGGVALLE